MKRGFSFVEVMFAVIILGIGFIMVAAIFPVAIQQAKTTSDEVKGANTARVMASAVAAAMEERGRAAALTNVPPLAVGSSPHVFPVIQQPSDGPGGSGPLPLWRALRDDLIMPADVRNAAVVLFGRRDFTEPTAMVWIVPVHATARPTFMASDLEIPKAWSPSVRWSANLQAREVMVCVLGEEAVPEAAGLIAFDARSSVPAFKRANIQAAAPGAFVIIANDHCTTAGNIGRVNGRIMRLGSRRTDLDGNTSYFPGLTDSVVYELQPGESFTGDPGADGARAKTGADAADDIEVIGMAAPSGLNSSVTFSGPAEAFLVGRSYSAQTLERIAAKEDFEPVEYEGPAMASDLLFTHVSIP